MKVLKFLGVLAAMAGCAPLEISAPFSAKEVSYIKSNGRAVIEGQAFMRQRGGGVVTCAGTNVVLVPAGAYATELFTKMWGDPNSGFANVLTSAPAERPNGFEEHTRKAPCDAEGDYKFTGVPNGTYYVISKVVWNVPGSYIPEGGVVGKRIRVRGGQSQRVLISR